MVDTNEKHNIPNEYAKSNYESIDFDKLLGLTKKSLPWIALIFIITLSVAYFTIRWTKPLYKSESELKLDFKSEATALGINTVMENQNLNHISGEIELLSSKLFFKKVIEAANIKVAYSSRGNILNDERYTFSPFVVSYKLKDSLLLDSEIDIKFISEDQYELSLYVNNQSKNLTSQFDKPINLYGSEIIVHKSKYFKKNDPENYFFVIKSTEALYGYFKENLEVTPLNFQANTIKISLTDHNQHKAQELINIINSIYLTYSQEQKTIENNNKISWLNGELKNIENQLEEYEDYFEKFTIKNRTNDLDKVLVETIQGIRKLDSQRYNLQQRLVDISTLSERLHVSTDEYSPVSYSSSDLSASILTQLEHYNALILDFNRIKNGYSQNTYTYTKKHNEVEAERALLSANINEIKQNISYELRQVSIKKNRLENSFNDIPSKEREHEKAQLYYSLYEEQYLALMQARTDFEVAKAGAKNDIIILSPATLPLSPISPNKPIIYGIGLVAGLVLSIFFVGLRYLLSNSISKLSDLERLTTGSTILGAIPKYTTKKLSETKLIVHESTRSSISEALRSIRTNLEFLGSGKNKVISITSTVSTEGKTFVSVNLGGILSLSGRKVIIVDMDMRKPRVHKAFGNTDTTKGVSTVLIGKHTLDESICTTEIDTLHYLPAGPTPPNPSELIINGPFERLIAELSKKYDHIILDTPPASIVTDAVLVMKKADIPIYVFRADFSKKEFVKVLKRLKYVNKFNNIALILNGLVNSGSKKYGYGYYVDENK